MNQPDSDMVLPVTSTRKKMGRTEFARTTTRTLDDLFSWTASLKISRAFPFMPFPRAGPCSRPKVILASS